MSYISDLSNKLKRFLNRNSSNRKPIDIDDDSNSMDYDPRFNDNLVQKKGLCFKVYYENWENETFESLLEVNGALELELIFKDKVLSNSFGLI